MRRHAEFNTVDSKVYKYLMHELLTCFQQTRCRNMNNRTTFHKLGKCRLGSLRTTSNLNCVMQEGSLHLKYTSLKIIHNFAAKSLEYSITKPYGFYQ